MSNPKLIDWIKSEEAKGYSDKKLKITLLKKGWPEKDVDKAIDLTHKRKVNWMPLLIAFISSLVILFFMSGIKFEGIIILFGLFGSLLVLIYSAIIYFNSNKKECFWELFIINYTSGMIAFSLTLILFNLITLIVFLTKAILPIYVIGIILAMMIFVLFYLFFFCVVYLSKRFLGYFNHEAYFNFKWKIMWLFKANWEKKWTLIKYPLIIIVIALVIAGFVFNAYVYQTKGDVFSTIGAVKEQLIQQQSGDLMAEYLKTKELSNYDDVRAYPFINEANGVSLDSMALKDVSVIYFDCDFKKMICKKFNYSHNIPLEDQVEIKERVSTIHVYDFPDKELAYIDTSESYEWISSISFSKEQLELPIFNEIKKDEKEVFTFIFNLEEDVEVTWFNVFDFTKDSIVTFSRMGLDLGRFRSKINPAEFEFKAIKEFEEKGTFYDGAISLKEHIDLLQSNVNQLNDIFKEKEELFVDNINPWSDMLHAINKDYSWKVLFSFDRSYTYFIGRLDKLTELEKELEKVRYDKGIKRIVNEQFSALENTNSDKDKIIRLKIIEVTLAEDLFNNCRNYNEGVKVCWGKILELTQTPELFENEHRIEEIKRQINVS